MGTQKIQELSTPNNSKSTGEQLLHYVCLIKQILNPYQLNQSELKVLKILKVNHPTSLSHHHISKTLNGQIMDDLPGTIDEMIKKGIIAELRKENAKTRLFYLTDDGLNKAKQTKDIINQIFGKSEIWSNQEIATLNKWVDKLG